jgi:ribosomal protein S18 acetylase RimI-like enzyme
LGKPNSIRTAVTLLYVNIAFMLVSVVRFISYLISPPAQDAAKLAESKGTSLLFLAVSILFLAAYVFAAILIRRKKRKPAVSILAVLSAWFLLTGSTLLLLIGVVAIFLLFSRSAKAYFNDSLPIEAETEEAVQTEESTAQLEATRPVPRVKADPAVEIRPAGADDAMIIHTLMMESFEEYRAAIPPSSALEETVESVREALEAGQGAAILYEDERPVAMVRFEIRDDAIHFFRLSVIPSRRRRGYSKRLVRWVEHQGRSKGLDYSRCKVRQTVQNNVAMYQDMGYEIVDQELVVRPEGSVKALTMEKKLLV